MAAVLDTKWTLASPAKGRNSVPRGLLGAADAKGQITLYQLSNVMARNQSIQFKQLAAFTFNQCHALCLSLDWSDRRHQYPPAAAAQYQTLSDASLIVSQSNGSLAYMPSLQAAILGDSSRLPAKGQEEVELQDNSDEDEPANRDEAGKPPQWQNMPVGLETWHAHDHEAWIAAFDAFSEGQIVWSGGDDLALKGWDMRTPIRRGRRDTTFTNRRSFDGGITTMQSHWNRQNSWAVGSYDSGLRLIDARMPLRPISTLELPGGIWRLKWHPSDPDLLLAGCMYGGFTVVKVTADGTDPEVVSTFENHDSLAYGCDWDRGEKESVQNLAREHDSTSRELGSLIYSCSFYDRKLRAWIG